MNDAVQNHNIDVWIRGLPAKFSSWPKIFQVPPYLRNLNEKAYEPKLISIGPYHRQKDHLKAMETHKGRFLKDLLQRTGQNSAQIYVEAMRGMMENARNYYEESLVISNEEFLKMMVLDGCFIVELFFKLIKKSFIHSILSSDNQICFKILTDLILVENQLPFFVLWKFLRIPCNNDHPGIGEIIELFGEVMPKLKPCQSYGETSINGVKHLLELLCTNWLSSVGSMTERELEKRDVNWDFIRSATKLREAGIKLRKGNEDNLFDIKFENGTLYIPPVNFEDRIELFYFNIIAYEQFDNSGSQKRLTEYVTVMDFLIDTEKDVELLCQKDIMYHWLGTDEAAAKMFNRLGSELLINSDFFFYAKLFNNVNKHCHEPWNRRMASLRHNYFNTPWALISFFAAAFLLLLTLLQTTFTIFPRS
ncbi:hypothetical protein SLEP1_g32406 [Rubroshorea leprosula]|uniref:Uncharacterized protein n=1 Tax=Rubroshorea leprosula TaxID=152421 RepID=A0AAV5KD90_9ROSI|nr:hypothetical protein SLEP1_g32406 [Rubroshorea leprosula]